MHFEVLVEDLSGKIAVTHFLGKILGSDQQPHSWRIISYKGSGEIPRNLGREADPRKRILLDKLPSLLRGYGKTFQADAAAVIVVCDLDRRDYHDFEQHLQAVLAACNPRPRTLFRLAIEEAEAWLLGDRTALEQAYPGAKRGFLDRYAQDSICGTWEVLADAVHPDGAEKLKKKGYPEVGKAKCEWAGRIAPLVDVDRNQSPSFRHFRDGIRDLAGMPSAPALT